MQRKQHTFLYFASMYLSDSSNCFPPLRDNCAHDPLSLLQISTECTERSSCAHALHTAVHHCAARASLDSLLSDKSAPRHGGRHSGTIHTTSCRQRVTLHQASRQWDTAAHRSCYLFSGCSIIPAEPLSGATLPHGSSGTLNSMRLPFGNIMTLSILLSGSSESTM